ncbi:hypothetical protein ACF0H5_007092 [Mactra antiquata]
MAVIDNRSHQQDTNQSLKGFLTTSAYTHSSRVPQRPHSNTEIKSKHNNYVFHNVISQVTYSYLLKE